MHVQQRRQPRRDRFRKIAQRLFKVRKELRLGRRVIVMVGDRSQRHYGHPGQGRCPRDRCRLHVLHRHPVLLEERELPIERIQRIARRDRTYFRPERLREMRRRVQPLRPMRILRELRQRDPPIVMERPLDKKHIPDLRRL